MPKVSKSNFKPYFDIKINEAYNASDRKQIAQEIIDEIIARTESGLDADNIDFVGYSKDYKKEKGQDNVDLTFSGDMLNQIRMLKADEPNTIRIGFKESYKGIGKVEGNILGTYGNSKPVNKGRNFLGITNEDLKRILSNYETPEDTAIAKEAGKAASKIVKNSNVEEFDDET